MSDDRDLHAFPARASIGPILRHAFAAALIACACLTGCGGGNTIRIESTSGVIEPAVRTAVYRFSDPNTADIYLSDIPEDELLNRLTAGIEGAPASVIHIHLFLSPKAGKTPIDFTASNASINYVVLTGTSMGIYGGGGFLLPSATVGDSEFTGLMKEATLRLTRGGADFSDRLGTPLMSSRVSARRDDAFAARITDELTYLVSQ